MVPALVPRRATLREAAISGFATATDLADYLVRAGLPFRDAHEVVGRAVARTVAAECDLAELSWRRSKAFQTASRKMSTPCWWKAPWRPGTTSGPPRRPGSAPPWRGVGRLAQGL